MPRRKKLSPRSLTPAEMAKVLRAAGSEFATEASVKADIASGAPCITGRLNARDYAAWLLLKRKDGRAPNNG